MSVSDEAAQIRALLGDVDIEAQGLKIPKSYSFFKDDI